MGRHATKPAMDALVATFSDPHVIQRACKINNLTLRKQLFWPISSKAHTSHPSFFISKPSEEILCFEGPQLSPTPPLDYDCWSPP